MAKAKRSVRRSNGKTTPHRSVRRGTETEEDQGAAPDPRLALDALEALEFDELIELAEELSIDLTGLHADDWDGIIETMSGSAGDGSGDGSGAGSGDGSDGDPALQRSELEAMTKPKLVELAEELSIDLGGASLKADIIDVMTRTS